MKKLLLVLLVLLGLQTQAQVNWCDSIEINITNQSFSQIQIESNVPSMNIAGLIEYYWNTQRLHQGVLSLVSEDSFATHNIFVNNQYDTLYTCLTLLICDNNGMVWTCYNCDTLVYTGFGGWMMLSTAGNPTPVIELEQNITLDNKIYDLLGREIFEIPTGTIYIKNGKKYLRNND